jgi:predicted O-methyltransferase YrrM
MAALTRAGAVAALIVLGGLTACRATPPAADGSAPPTAAATPAAIRDVSEADVADVLASIRAVDSGLLSVSDEDGRFLRVMAAASGATRALEIGAGFGFSTIWIGLGLRQTGGHLTAIEYDPERAAAAARNLERAGLTDVVTLVAGDAFAEIPRLEGDFDFVFLDAWKPDYRRFFDLVEPRLRPGGLFLAHNVVNKAGEMGGFLEAIDDTPQLWTTIVRPSGEGISVSWKLRN